MYPDAQTAENAKVVETADEMERRAIETFPTKSKEIAVSLKSAQTKAGQAKWEDSDADLDRADESLGHFKGTTVEQSREFTSLMSQSAQQRKAIQPQLTEARRRNEAAAASANRKVFASRYERQLLDAHLNPESVSASGTTLHVQIWMCSRQFIYDFTNGTIARESRDAGFTRIECSNGLDTWSQEF